jgi:hypothetical protein
LVQVTLGDVEIGVMEDLRGPPLRQARPPQAGLRQGPGVDQAGVGAPGDLDGVVQSVAKHDLGLGAGGGEDQVLQLPRDPGGAAAGDQLLEVVVVPLGQHGTRDVQELGKPTLLEPRLHVGELAAERVLPLTLGSEPEALAERGDVVGLDLAGDRAGDRVTQRPRLRQRTHEAMMPTRTDGRSAVGSFWPSRVGDTVEHAFDARGWTGGGDDRELPEPCAGLPGPTMPALPPYGPARRGCSVILEPK